MSLRPALAVCLLALLSACTASRKLADPVLLIETDGGRELGVSTEYGVVFLGRTARSGPVTVTAWFGDGPSMEASVIEPLGGGLYTAETEIRLPQVPMTFRTPLPGERVAVVGRRQRDWWYEFTYVASDVRVEGLILDPIPDLQNAPTQIGAGVYVDDIENERYLLIGLVSGTVRLTGPDGREREYLTVMGPEDLWRLVTFRREVEHKRRWVYREDIL
jgi:hypothetical protein